MVLCQIENLKNLKKYADSLIKCRISLGCCRLGNLKTDRLLWFYVRSKTSKPQKMKNCCELPSKLRQSLDLKNFKTIRWPPAQNKNLKTSNLKTAALLWQNFKTSGFLWPQLQIRNSKTSKQLDYCDRSSKSKPQNFKNTWIILAPAANRNFKHFKNYVTI